MITKIVEDRDKLICCCIYSQAKNFPSVYIPKGCELGFFSAGSALVQTPSPRHQRQIPGLGLLLLGFCAGTFIVAYGCETYKLQMNYNLPTFHRFNKC